MGRRIFISYRRDDAAGDARGIRDRLVRKFGKSAIFMDVDNLLAGQRFDRELETALSQCDVLIAVIGPRWMDLLSERIRGDERDYVRDEIAAALKRNVFVIPVLVGQEGRMPPLPRRNDLPEDIRDLVLHQKHNVAHESFGRDTDDLIAAINAVRRGGRRAVPWKAIAVAGAAGLAAAVILLSYRADMLPWVQSRPGTEDATVAAKKKADEDDAARKRIAADSARKAAEEEARRKADEEAKLDVVTDCDRLAASPLDATRPSGVAGVDLAKVDAVAATAACDDAMRRYPAVARFVFQAGRAAYARKDYTRAVELYRAAIAKGSAAAMNTLGALYRNGQGVAQDYAEARKWFEKAAALGDARAMTNLGALYHNGLGVALDYAEARRWYEKAAVLGDPDAMNGLGILYHYGGGGVAQNYAEARKWYGQGAALGNAGAMNGLGILYYGGQGVAQDYVEARKWFEKAAALGNAGAMSNLGVLYHFGQGVARDYAEARKWYERAAALGDEDAMFNLGVVYEEGLGVSKDIQQAREWYQKAADAGLVKAKAKLANLKK